MSVKRIPVSFDWPIHKTSISSAITNSPLNYTSARKEKASKASAKHAGVEGGVCERLPFCAGAQFSSDSIRAFNDGIKVQQNKGNHKP